MEILSKSEVRRKDFLKTAWQEEMRNEVQKVREEMKNIITERGLNRLFAVLDEIIRRV